ncbi:MAG TPA: DHA2 family efflux MFS transporter permease subunit [Rhizomicrobium sp.]|nr:DHA2 family efflux MFS transporter permease subunit [Rhizomicrobium sp.]
MTVSPKSWIGFGAMCIGMFMAILDIQVVASSLTNIQSALNITSDRMSWIQTGYLIAEVIAIPLTGWLTRALSLRWMFVLATLGFTLASLGCALCTSLEPLLAVRVFQGFCGGMLIPGVFTSAFTQFPEKDRVLATMVAGTFAMIAPTIGPAVGGYLTETYSWHWIFLVNIVPGLVVALLVGFCVAHEKANLRALTRINYATILLAAVFLGTLELLLKEAPKRGWHGMYVMLLIIVCTVSAAAGVAACLRSAHPFVNLRRFRDLSFSLGCALSFVFGLGVYGATYLLSVFLGLVRGHTPLEIGEVMMVSGAVQLLTAPLAAWLETRIDPRLLTAIGFGLFGAGLLMNGFERPSAMMFESSWMHGWPPVFQWLFEKSDDTFWPQVIRGVSIMLCLLPATRLALERWPQAEVPDASAMFNLMRNLGGAIGIALIDTILEQRTQGHLDSLVARLQARDVTAAREVGIPLKQFLSAPAGPVDDMTKAILGPMVKRAALTQSFNEAWLLIAILFAVSLLALPLIRRAHIADSAMGPGAH